MKPPQLVLASGNAGKLEEFRELLAAAGCPARLRGLGEFPGVRMPDEGTDYAVNAALKATSIARATGLPALADDSGIEAVALGGAPGPLSARYGGAALDDRGRVAHLLAELRGAEDRRAAFVCWAALAWPSSAVVVRHGRCEGTLLAAPAGQGGFGYDPVFRPDGFDVSMAEVSSATKNLISHRARALRALAPYLDRL